MILRHGHANPRSLEAGDPQGRIIRQQELGVEQAARRKRGRVVVVPDADTRVDPLGERPRDLKGQTDLGLCGGRLGREISAYPAEARADVSR